MQLVILSLLKYNIIFEEKAAKKAAITVPYVT